MLRNFSATVWQEGEWYIAQCLDMDVASQDKTVEYALANLGEALTLHFREPVVTGAPNIA